MHDLKGGLSKLKFLVNIFGAQNVADRVLGIGYTINHTGTFKVCGLECTTDRKKNSGDKCRSRNRHKVLSKEGWPCGRKGAEEYFWSRWNLFTKQ